MKEGGAAVLGTRKRARKTGILEGKASLKAAIPEHSMVWVVWVVENLYSLYSHQFPNCSVVQQLQLQLQMVP